jgi:hypothetical protein
MSAQHTPGPWTAETTLLVDSQPIAFAIMANADCQGHPVAEVEGNTSCREPGEWAANARLIAAAPEMYEALKAAEQFISNGIEVGFIRMPDADTPDPAHNTLPAVRAAIAKAEGRS